MEQSGTSEATTRKRGKAKIEGGRGRRIWTKREEEFLLSAMIELVTDPKWKLDTGAFRNGFFVEVEKKLVLAFPGTDLRSSPHIESKVKAWKKNYHTISDMLKTSGFGWDDEAKMVLVDSEDVWQAYIKKEPDATNMRDKPFPFYEDWLVLFGKDRATGELAEGVVDMVDNMNLEELDADVDGLPTDVPQETHSTGPASLSATTISKGGKKRGRANEGVTKCLNEMVASFSACFHESNTSMAKIADAIGYAKEGRIARKNLNEALMMLPLTIKQRCRALRLLSKDDNLVDIFYSMSENMERMELIEGLLEES
ncbi:hypothetical protein Dimus_038331 [Dionaea muscipula]